MTDRIPAAGGDWRQSGPPPQKRAPTVLVASGYTGHHLPYLRIIWRRASESGITVVAALPREARDSEELALHLGDIQHHLEFIYLDTPISPKSLARVAREVGADHVLIPNGDRFMMKLAIAPRLPRDIRYTTLVMQDPRWEIAAGHGLRLRARLKLALSVLASSRLHVRVVWLRGPGYTGSPSDYYVNDPVIAGTGGPDSPVSHALGSLDRNKYWFAMIGVTNWWKNPGLVLEALAAVEQDNLGLLIAGPISPDLAPAIRQQTDSLAARGVAVIVLDRHITNGEMNDAVRAADCVVVAYATHAPPSSIGKVGSYGSRVIVAGSTTLRAHAEFLGDIAIRCELDVRSVTEAMRTAVSTTPSSARPNLQEHFADVLLDLSEYRPEPNRGAR